jgi:metal-sulfur cluster biosynthetic enzyme
MPAISREQVIDVLKQCYDPEIPIDLWNLGLIYDIQIQDSYTPEKSDVNIVMTLTTPGCGLAHTIARDVKQKLENLYEVQQASVQITFDPPWEPRMMSEEARARLGLAPSTDLETSGGSTATEWE